MKKKLLILISLALVITSAVPIFAGNEKTGAPTGLRVNMAGDYFINFIIDYNKTMAYDCCEIQYSEDPSFSNSSTIYIKRREDVPIEDLKAGKRYYFRARYLKNGEPVSDYATMSAMTGVKRPSTSPKNPTTKAIITQMKKKRSFVYNFPQGMNENDAEWYIKYICYGLPHYDCYNAEFAERDGLVVQVKMTYDKKKAKKAKKIRKKINRIVKKARKKKGRKAKIYYLNEKICETCSYDWNAYRRGVYNCPDSQSAYGCLVKHKCICDGYARAFYTLARELKIPVKYVSGDNHAWNKVKYKGKWYYVDVTSNDATHRYKNILKKKQPRPNVTVCLD